MKTNRNKITKNNNEVKLSIADKFNKNYPKILRFISELSLVIFSLIKTLLTTVGLIIVLILLYVVEANRTMQGILFFEASHSFALYGAWVMVIYNSTIEFMTQYEKNKFEYAETDNNVWSLRLVLSSLKYRLGIGKNWKVKTSKKTSTFVKLQRGITVTIIVLALVGSMSEEIISQGDVKWYLAIFDIFTNSSLELMSAWVSGLLFTMTSVFGAQAIARYIAIQATSAENDMKILSQKIVNKEQGIVIVDAKSFASKHKSLKNLTNLHDDDKIQLKPTFSFYNGIEKTWSREYRSKGGFMNMIVTVVEKRNING